MSSPAPMPSSRFIPPVQPPHLKYIEDEREPGVYLVANDKFHLADQHITKLLHQQITNADEFILGVLSVLLIAVLSEMVYVILLRTSKKRGEISQNRVLSAFLFSEFEHLRIVSRHFNPSQWFRRHRPSSPTIVRQSLPSKRPEFSTALSVTVLVFAVVIFAIDVLVVALTQPKPQQSEMGQYNLRAVQPVFTESGISSYISRMALDRPCVSPFMSNGSQTRRFQVQSCVYFSYKKDLFTRSSITENVTIESYFHRGGFDHNISFPPAWIAVTTRVDVLLSEEDGGSRHLLFDVLDNGSFKHTRYMHNLVMYYAKEKLCRGDTVYEEFCANASAETDGTVWSSRKKKVHLWEDKYEDVIGVVSEFRNVNMPAPYWNLRSGSKVFLPGAAIFEISGESRYVPFGKDMEEGEEAGIANLLVEQKRVAGVVVLLVLFSVMALLLVFLRLWLQPVSLERLALSRVDDAVYQMFGRDDEECEPPISLGASDFPDGVEDYRNASYSGFTDKMSVLPNI